jgi:hypothetical protein
MLKRSQFWKEYIVPKVDNGLNETFFLPTISVTTAFALLFLFEISQTRKFGSET